MTRFALAAGLALLAIWVTPVAWGRETVEFELCHYPTGKPTGVMVIEGARSKGKAPIYTDQVQLVMPLEGDKCTLLVLQSQNQAYVIGNYREVLCKLHGGPNCTFHEIDRNTP